MSLHKQGKQSDVKDSDKSFAAQGLDLIHNLKRPQYLLYADFELPSGLNDGSWRQFEVSYDSKINKYVLVENGFDANDTFTMGVASPQTLTFDGLSQQIMLYSDKIKYVLFEARRPRKTPLSWTNVIDNIPETENNTIILGSHAK